MSDSTHHSSFRIVLGLGLIAAGILYTLSNLGVVDADRVTPWWPVLLVVYGLLRIIGIWCRPSWITGSLFVVGGSWWVLHNLGLLPFDVWQLWPLLFIFMGVGMMRRGRWGRYIAGIGYVGISRRGRLAQRIRDAVGPAVDAARSGVASDTPGWPPTDAPASAPADVSGKPPRGPEAEGVLRVDVFLSSISRTVASQEFRGGDVVAFLGGAEIDLRAARMAEAIARLEVHLIMGGVTLIVPPDWVVEFQGTPIMGGIDDQSRRPAGEIRGRLVLTGAVLLSGIVIKN
jgi:hypothetical protein